MRQGIFCWSGGKDSALALYKALQYKDLKIVGLLTTISEANQRISMHGVRFELLKKQAEAIGLPLYPVWLPNPAPMEVYNHRMLDAIELHKSNGVEVMLFGDIFLEDLRQYRETQIRAAGMEAIFPLWGIDTKNIASDFIRLGFKTIITSAEGEKLNVSFVGRDYNHQFLSDLPKGVDPCGENGEFHTFAYDGPLFKKPVMFKKGKVSSHSYTMGDIEQKFWFFDLE